MSTPSILSAIHKLRCLLTRSEKIKWLGIAGFAICTSILEVVTASIIVIFVQVINIPSVGQKYLSKVGFNENLTAGHIVLYMAIIFGLSFLIKNSVAAIEVFYQNITIQKMSYQFKKALLHRYAKADYAFYLTRNSSFGVAVVEGDGEQIFSNGMLALASILSEGVVFICLISLVVYMNPSLAFIIFGIIAILGIVVAKWLLPQFYRFGLKLQEASLYSGQSIFQFFHAFKEIVLLGKREAFVDAYDKHSSKKSRTQAIQMAINAMPRMIIEVLFVGLFVVTIAFLFLEKENPIAMLGILGGYLYLGFRVMPGLNRMINQLNNFKAVIPSIERVHAEYTTVAATEHYLDIPALTFEDSLTISGISFRYLNTEKNALSDISLTIKKGECIGIVGETGSGKSTLVDLMLGLLLPYSGTILIDKHYAVNSYQWHKKIGYVPQAIYLTDDTIEANIAFGETEIDQVRLNAAIDAAQLRKFILLLPEGLKTMVGERGMRLSGGERQRIAIARALYHQPEVLIFDEATSALDHDTEERLMKTIHAVSQDRTVIMIAHRITTLKNCTRIVAMAKGHLSQITTYNELQKIT